MFFRLTTNFIKVMANSKFYELIKDARIEKDVENVYTQGINLYFPDSVVEHPFACDAFIDSKTSNEKMLKLIIEYKFDEDFSTRTARSKVITQVLYYMKRFEQNGMILPNVVMVGDINECFVFHSNDIIGYLDEDIDWSYAPSEAHLHNPELIYKLNEDENINPFIFTVDENFSFKDVVEKINDLADNIQRYVHVTEHNIATIFEYFCDRVIKDRKKVQANDLVAVFMGVITKNENYYLHPSKKNTLVTPQGNVAVQSDAFKGFFSYFNRNYTPREKNRFAEISDRLIEDTNRRNKGEFYTPTLFVDYAHKMIAEQFGEDWKEKYVVWDNSAGSKNLTRDYYFKELYSSTLEQAELEISSQYNKEATSFQFDFLNDPLEKLPQGLIEALEQDKPIIFFMNPPYGSAANKMGADGSSKKGVAKTMMNEVMLEDGIGACAQNLYAQFIYRCLTIKQYYNLTNCNIAMFTPTLYLSGPSWKKFRKEFFGEFSYADGCTFKASHFADVADSWGISFSVWNGGTDGKNEFEHKLIDSIDGTVEIVGSKVIYNADMGTTASEWCKEPIKSLKTQEGVNVSSAIVIRPDNSDNRGTNFEGNLGYFLNAGNNVDMNTQKVSLFSTEYGNGNGHGLSADNFTRCTSLFAARKLVEKNWINSKDEYLKPNTEHEKWQEFENDSIVYSLFNTSSNQSSLRQVEYKGKLWDIKNEFFWMSKDVMIALSEEFSNDYCYNDARVSQERYVYGILKDMELSAEAKAVLNKARELVAKSFKYRPMFNEEHPEYQVMNWDASYYQLKPIWKEYFKEEFEEFKVLYKKLSEKMLPMVYELGFLRK